MYNRRETMRKKRNLGNAKFKQLESMEREIKKIKREIHQWHNSRKYSGTKEHESPERVPWEIHEYGFTPQHISAEFQTLEIGTSSSGYRWSN